MIVITKKGKRSLITCDCGYKKELNNIPAVTMASYHGSTCRSIKEFRGVKFQ